jgi:hypothetical protein
MADTRESADREFVVLERAFAKKAEELLDGFTVALQDFSTEDLRGIAAYRDSIHPDGWMQRVIREYVDVWR